MYFVCTKKVIKREKARNVLNVNKNKKKKPARIMHSYGFLPNGTFFDTVGLMHLERGIISECNHPK